MAEWIRVVAFQTVRLRNQEGVGSNQGPGKFSSWQKHKVSLLKRLSGGEDGQNCLSLMPSLNK